jgi:hypothetical protein
LKDFLHRECKIRGLSYACDVHAKVQSAVSELQATHDSPHVEDSRQLHSLPSVARCTYAGSLKRREQQFRDAYDAEAEDNALDTERDISAAYPTGTLDAATPTLGALICSRGAIEPFTFISTCDAETISATPVSPVASGSATASSKKKQRKKKKEKIQSSVEHYTSTQSSVLTLRSTQRPSEDHHSDSSLTPLPSDSEETSFAGIVEPVACAPLPKVGLLDVPLAKASDRDKLAATMNQEIEHFVSQLRKPATAPPMDSRPAPSSATVSKTSASLRQPKARRVVTVKKALPQTNKPVEIGRQRKRQRANDGDTVTTASFHAEGVSARITRSRSAVQEREVSGLASRASCTLRNFKTADSISATDRSQLDSSYSLATMPRGISRESISPLTGQLSTAHMASETEKITASEFQNVVISAPVIAQNSSKSKTGGGRKRGRKEFEQHAPPVEPESTLAQITRPIARKPARKTCRHRATMAPPAPRVSRTDSFMMADSIIRDAARNGEMELNPNSDVESAWEQDPDDPQPGYSSDEYEPRSRAKSRKRNKRVRDVAKRGHHPAQHDRTVNCQEHVNAPFAGELMYPQLVPCPLLNAPVIPTSVAKPPLPIYPPIWSQVCVHYSL